MIIIFRLIVTILFSFLEYAANKPFAFDVVFAVGGFGPDAEGLFRMQKIFVNTFLDSFQYPIENGFIQFGLMQYGRNARVVKNLDQNYVITYIRKYLNDMRVDRTGAAIGKVFDSAADSVFSRGRRDVPRFLVVFTDATGYHSRSLLRYAKQKLLDKNVRIIMVGAGNKIRLADMVTMAGRPSDVIRTHSSKTFMQTYYPVVQRILNCKFYARFHNISIKHQV